MADRVFRFGMVGGGQGSLIGDAQRKGATFDGMAILSAGCFSRDFENTKQTGAGLGVAPERLYRTYQEMAAVEAAREDGIDFVVIVTPNSTHYEVAKAFLLQGIHVVCDKPLALTSDMGRELKAIAEQKGLLFCVTHTYIGYAMVEQMRLMVQRGVIGKVRVVSGRYIQGWLARGDEEKTSKQALWRCDPAQSGISNCVGDIGTHLWNLVSHTTGLHIDSLCAVLESVNNRPLDNNGEILVKFVEGGSAVLWCSQIAIGSENDLRISIHGETGSIAWEQENPNYLQVTLAGQPAHTLSRGDAHCYPEVLEINRIPPGHVEGHFTAFANIYRAFMTALRQKEANQPITARFPTVDYGIEGNQFVERCVQSSKEGSVWVKF